MRDDEKPERPFTRFSAFTFLLVGYAVSIGIGLLIGWHTQGFMNGITMLLPREVANPNIVVYSSAILLIPDLVVYPPIAVLIVDSMQALTAKMD